MMTIDLLLFVEVLFLISNCGVDAFQTKIIQLPSKSYWHKDKILMNRVREYGQKIFGIALRCL